MNSTFMLIAGGKEKQHLDFLLLEMQGNHADSHQKLGLIVSSLVSDLFKSCLDREKHGLVLTRLQSLKLEQD